MRWWDVQPVYCGANRKAVSGTGYDAMLSAETTAWAGSLQSNAPYAVWRGASSLVAGVEPEWEAQFLSLTCPVTLFSGRSLCLMTMWIIFSRKALR
jgi:hypothetical protein